MNQEKQQWLNYQNAACLINIWNSLLQLYLLDPYLVELPHVFDTSFVNKIKQKKAPDLYQFVYAIASLFKKNNLAQECGDRSLNHAVNLSMRMLYENDRRSEEYIQLFESLAKDIKVL